MWYRICIGLIHFGLLLSSAAFAQSPDLRLANTSWILTAYSSKEGETVPVIPQPEVGAGPYEISFLKAGGL